MKKKIKYMAIGAFGYAIITTGVKYWVNNTKLGRQAKKFAQGQVANFTGIFMAATNAAEEAIEQQQSEQA